MFDFKPICIIAASFALLGCQTTGTPGSLASSSSNASSDGVRLPKDDPGGEAASYGNNSFSAEIPESARPNDATISAYEDRRRNFINRRKSQGQMYSIKPKGNAVAFVEVTNPPSAILDEELAKGYILSYLYYEDGVIKYNGKAAPGRFAKDIDDRTLFFTHSTGKSVVSYIVAHAICDGYINSIDETIDWPMMSETLYQGQPLRNLLNMNAGDSHTVDKNTTRVMGSRTHHRDQGLDTNASFLAGTGRRGNDVFYNNFLTDVIANYVAFRAGNNYDRLLREVFQNKVKIEHEVLFEMHKKTPTDGQRSAYYGQPQTRMSYSFFMTRMDFLRVAQAMMRDYQNQTCVGQYLREAQAQALPWYKYRPSDKNAKLWLNKFARGYGLQFYFDFQGMEGRNILATEGKNSQNMMIDMDNSRIVITNSAASAWDQRIFVLDVIREGRLPR